MAKEGINIFKSDICISVTGYHEPSNESYAFFCIYINEKNFDLNKIELKEESRELNRMYLINAILNKLFETFKK